MCTLQLRFMPKLLTYLTLVPMGDEWMRRDEAAKTVARYCDVHKGRVRPKRTTSECPALDGGVRQGTSEGTQY